MPTRDHRGSGPDERELLAELARIYADVDASFAGASCDNSTDCCQFSMTRREPYVTSIELLALERAVAARGGPRSFQPARATSSFIPAGRAARKSAPSSARRHLPVAREDGICPLLDVRGRCAVYASRPLGCRTFFCDRARGRDVPHAAVLDAVDRVRALARRHERDGDLGRALQRALGR